jgi:23S rRNA pseudouridine2605 synthase
MEKSKNRLSKILANAGVASRRACEELIFDGRVTVNGEICKVPQTMVGYKDSITVDGEPVKKAAAKVYYILNKPPGYLCTHAKHREDKIIWDLFEGVKERLFTIGRLDKDTAGLLLVTNDGHFANEVIHPSKNIQKEYLVKTDQDVSDEHLKAISAGTLVEGSFVKPLSVTKVRKGTVKVVIMEGKKREVRCLMEAAGLQVHELTRIRLGGLILGTLPLGTWRELTAREKKLIFE